MITSAEDAYLSAWLPPSGAGGEGLVPPMSDSDSDDSDDDDETDDRHEDEGVRVLLTHYPMLEQSLCAV